MFLILLKDIFIEPHDLAISSEIVSEWKFSSWLLLASIVIETDDSLSLAEDLHNFIDLRFKNFA